MAKRIFMPKRIQFFLNKGRHFSSKGDNKYHWNCLDFRIFFEIIILSEKTENSGLEKKRNSIFRKKKKIFNNLFLRNHLNRKLKLLWKHPYFGRVDASLFKSRSSKVGWVPLGGGVNFHKETNEEYFFLNLILKHHLARKA